MFSSVLEAGGRGTRASVRAGASDGMLEVDDIGRSESNFSETISAMLYVWRDEPTWKITSVSLPPTNLPLMRLPFFNSSESDHASEVSNDKTTTTPILNLIFSSPRPC